MKRVNSYDFIGSELLLNGLLPIHKGQVCGFQTVEDLRAL